MFEYFDDRRLFLFRMTAIFAGCVLNLRRRGRGFEIEARGVVACRASLAKSFAVLDVGWVDSQCAGEFVGEYDICMRTGDLVVVAWDPFR